LAIIDMAEPSDVASVGVGVLWCWYTAVKVRCQRERNTRGRKKHSRYFCYIQHWNLLLLVPSWESKADDSGI